MNTLTRIVIASGAGLALAFTASPAMAAPPSSPESKGAYVEHSESTSPFGSSDYRTVTQSHGDNFYTINNREQQTFEVGSTRYSSDWKTHETTHENVEKFSSHNTLTVNGVTCRMNSLKVVTGDDKIRRDVEETC